MRLFSRFLMVAGLLGGLAYGSYAFGKYVLSNRLVGPQGSALQRHASADNSEHFGATVTRSSAVKGSPRAEIDILPSDEAGDAPEPDLSSARQHTERRPLIDPIAKKPSSAAEALDADGNPLPTATPAADVSIKPDDTTDITPLPRRKHHRKHLVHEVRNPGDDDAGPAAGEVKTSSLPARAQNDDGDSSRNTDAGPGNREDTAPAPRDLAPPVPVGRIDSGSSHDEGDMAPAPRPRRHHRERIKHENSDSNPTEHAPAHRSLPTRHHEESPVPRPEGDAGGGDSPVPLPG